ncbi:hypothetical protein [Cupriavidus sp. YR651]|uniref:hypothetical protein n=1 Tax=Cupriavidus sp. YR651 TaxID=1855315 RepID=UPI0015A15D7C|nr:hypothetical protein [Cupriavidus sp. YR651]
MDSLRAQLESGQALPAGLKLVPRLDFWLGLLAQQLALLQVDSSERSRREQLAR